MALDVVEFPDPIVAMIDFLFANIPGTVAVSAELPEDYIDHVLVFASSDDADMVTRRTRYVLECRSKSSDLVASALGQKVAALVSAWCRSGGNTSPSAYRLISLVDSFPDEGVPRSVVTCEVYWHAL